MNDTSHAVRSLGMFSVVDDFERLRDDILPLVGTLPKEECLAISNYLRAGAIVFTIMEWTSDMIGAFPIPRRDKLGPGHHILEVKGGRFAVAGGNGILTDGTYYWRRDAADYVEHYRVGLPDEFLHHGRSLGWVARPMADEDVLAVDTYLTEHGTELRQSILALIHRDSAG